MGTNTVEDYARACGVNPDRFATMVTDYGERSETPGVDPVMDWMCRHTPASSALRLNHRHPVPMHLPVYA